MISQLSDLWIIRPSDRKIDRTVNSILVKIKVKET